MLDDDTKELIASLQSQVEALNSKFNSDEPKPESQAAPQSANAFDADALVAKLQSVLESKNQESQQKILDRMFNEKMQNVLSSTPGFDEFMNSADDYGNVRMDAIKGISDHDKRLETLGKLNDAYKKAAAGSPGKAPVVSQKVAKAKEQAAEGYKDFTDKLDSGTFSGESEAFAAFAKGLSNEIDTLMRS